MKVRDWHTQFGWWIAGIFATGAVWYFLSTKNYSIATVSAVLAGAFAVITVVLHRIRDGQDGASVNRSKDEFEYQAKGRFGRNILSGLVHEVQAGQPVSMQADVPRLGNLHIVISGLSATYLSDGNSGWHFSLQGVVNWIAGTYQPTRNGGEQHFDAEHGNADMEITFARPGKLSIECFERGAPQPTWRKSIKVNAA